MYLRAPFDPPEYLYGKHSNRTGFPGTIRAIALVQLASCLFANVFLKSRLPPRRSGSMVEWAAFKEPEYAFYVVGSFFVR